MDGASSKWTVNNTLSIGLLGVGFVRVTNNGTLQAGKIEIGPLGSIDASGGTLIIGGTPPLVPANGSQHPNLPAAKHKQKYLTGNHSTGGVVYVDTLMISSGAQILADSVIFEACGYL